MLAPGDLAPEFALPDDEGTVVRLGEVLASGPLVLYFYPADFTLVCTKQACAFREVHPRLERSGIQVIGISPQGDSSHGRFRARHELPFRLLSDPDRSVARDYGVLGPFGLLIRRTTFLIGRDGRVLDAARSDLRVGPHVSLAERATGTDGLGETEGAPPEGIT